MSKTLVTGGAGFIGSNLIDALLEQGASVRVLDDFSTGKMENLSDVLKDIELIEGDIRDPEVLESSVGNVDTIFHLAAFVSVPRSTEDPDLCFDVNVNGTNKLLSAARKAGVKRVVLASSAAVYGDSDQVPLNETAELRPLSPYASSKQMDEILADIYSNQLDLEVVALRYFNVYGPRQSPESDYAAVIPIFLRTLLDGDQPVIYGDGLQSRDFIFVGDVIQANLLAAKSDKAPGQIINICSGEEINLLTLLDVMGEISNRDISPVYQEVRPGDIHRSLGDPTLSRKLLNLPAHTPLPEGLLKTLSWMKSS
jgi:UDP-glucose 4-epimerase